jgi:DNA-binding response OmpR family regulator
VDVNFMQKHRVLIVEDEQDIAGLIKHTLERSGSAEAEIVGSGDAALKAVSARPPDLVILDLNLPVLGGLEVCRLLRQRSDSRHLPIIMLTAKSSESDRVAGLEQGADDYVTKPFSLRELTARVKAVLRRSTSPEERQNKNRVVSRDKLLERVWGYDRLVETRSVDVHVGRLRQKLGPAGQQIETAVGLGYRFID